MKLLIISDAWHPQINGVVRTYQHLSEELEKLGHTVKVIGPADFPFRLPMPGYSEINLAIMPYRRLKKMIAAYEPDDIHIATEGPLGWASRRYCLKHNHSFTTSYHTHFPYYIAKRVERLLPFLNNITHKTAKNMVRYFHAPAKAIMIATQSLEDELKEWGFKTPMHRLSRGVNIDIFFPGEKTLFHDLPKPVALYVGRIAIEKNLEDFLDMKWKGSKVIVGEGPSLNEFKQKYTNVRFTGKKEGEELAAHYRSADLFVFPSRTDTFGIVLIEAIASGLPIAGYNVTGSKDIITEPFLGSLHEHNLLEASKNALKSGTPEQRSEHAKNYYTWENAARQYQKIIRK